MSTGYILAIFHIALFLFVRRKLKKKALRLEAENSTLRRENQKLTGEREYYKRELASR